MIIKRIIKKLLYRQMSDSESYVKYLRKKGVTIGNNVEFFSLQHVHVDDLNPHLLEIGNNVNIVGTEILTHDYGWSVIKGMTGEILGNQKKVKIGNNVFIGHGSVVLCGTTIEDNVIVGANSVVSGLLKKGSVYAGCPARRIMSINEYREKRYKNQFREAQEVVLQYCNRFGKDPAPDVLHEYFYLFTNATDKLSPVFNQKLMLCGNYEQSLEYINTHEAMFDSYEDFLTACHNQHN